ncbi:hypothetical protein EDB85DRAFT_2020245 [Lactarius pseudohatsudake]|nr:hypothetical protein EDB85DRAFT_2020245 [Lactarius pseudohatsudake]
MLPDAHMRTLRGPRPTPFTGNPAQAQQFLNEFRQLKKANPCHPFLYRPELRVRLALKHIDKNPKTDAWIHDAQSRDSGLTNETVWNDFLDSFCETWIYSPKSTISVVAPIVQPLTEVPSPSPAIASTLKRVDDMSIVLTTDELPPRCLLGTIDLTEDDADDWTLFAPRTSAPPTDFTIIAPVMTRNESSDPPPPLPLTATLDLATTTSAAQQKSPVTAPITTSPANHDDRERPLHDTRPDTRVYTQIAHHGALLTQEHRFVRQRPVVSPPPVDDSSGLSNPVLDARNPAHLAELPCASLALLLASTALGFTPPCTFVTGANSLKGGVRTLDTSVLDLNFDTPPAPISPASSPNLSTHRRSPIAAPPRDDDDWSLFTPSHLAAPSPSSPSPALFHTPTSVPSLGSLPSSPTNRCLSPSGIRTPSHIALLDLTALLNLTAVSDNRPLLSLPDIVHSTLDDIDDDADAILFASPPPSSPLVSAPLPPPSLSSRSPPTFQSFPVVVDDNVLIEGVKTFKTSVLIPDIAFSNLSLTYYPPIFLPRAFEQPQDPDEVTPVISITRRQSTTRTATQNRRRQDSPRPPDMDEVARHAMTRTLGRCPKSRKSSGQENNQQNDAMTVDPTTPHALHQRPHIRFTDNRDQHTRPKQEETTEVMDMAALQNRINAWHTQIVPEQTAPRICVTDSHFMFTPDPRNYAYDYTYQDDCTEG